MKLRLMIMPIVVMLIFISGCGSDTKSDWRSFRGQVGEKTNKMIQLYKDGLSAGDMRNLIPNTNNRDRIHTAFKEIRVKLIKEREEAAKIKIPGSFTSEEQRELETIKNAVVDNYDAQLIYVDKMMDFMSGGSQITAVEMLQIRANFEDRAEKNGNIIRPIYIKFNSKYEDGTK